MKLNVLPRSVTSDQAFDWSTTSPLMRDQDLITELQWLGMRLDNASIGVASRKGGAGPSDHKAVTVNGRTVMVPVHTHDSHRSPYVARTHGDANGGGAVLERDGVPVGIVTFPKQPRFYGLQTLDGIPYWKIAVRIARQPASSAPSASRSRPARPSPARRPSNSRRSPAPPCCWMA
jgi:hypothetical protein